MAGAAGLGCPVQAEMRTGPRLARDHARVIVEGVDGPRSIVLKGRLLWALRQLISAGRAGVKPIERIGPRWSHYVFKLRAEGLDIEPVRERHDGPYPGTHGRYVLLTTVAIEGGADG